MDITQVKTLLAVVDGGSMAAAARHLDMTPAAIRQRLQRLEKSTGSKLLQRSGQRVVPTRSCRDALPSLRRLVQSADDARGQLARREPSGPFRLGAIATVMEDHAVQLVGCFRERFPAVDLTLRPGPSAELYEALLRGELDAAVMVAPPLPLPKRVHSYALFQQHYGVVTASVKPGASARGWLVYDRKSWGGEAAWECIRETEPEPDVICEMDDPHALLALTRAGLGRTLLPKWNGLSSAGGVIWEAIPGVAPRRIVLLSREKDSIVDQMIASVVGSHHEYLA